jgi:hypothetical protein
MNAKVFLLRLLLLTVVVSGQAQVNEPAQPKKVAAGEFLHLRVDLDGDGHEEVVSFALSRANEAWRGVLTVKVAGARYKTEYFSAEGDIPTVSVTKLDTSRPERQLLVKVIEPDSCIYHLLAYKATRLIELAKLDGGPACNEPKTWGNGKLELDTWQGFWNKPEMYRLSADGFALTPEPQDHYMVRVNGIAGVDLQLADAGCPSTVIPTGAFLLVEIFDDKRNRYRLKSLTGACGWIPEAEVNTIDKIKELPWAG